LRLASHHPFEGWVNNRKWAMTKVCYCLPTSKLNLQRTESIVDRQSDRVVERIRSGVCRRNRFVLSSELKPRVNMLAKRYPQGRSAWVARIAPKTLLFPEKQREPLDRVHPYSAARWKRKSRHDLWTGQKRSTKQQIVIYARAGSWWVQPWPLYLGS